MPAKVFISYARKDEAFLEELKKHLQPLVREGLIDLWSDPEINAGAEWERKITQHLNEAQIILLLVSPDFMHSEYCYGTELTRALERHQQGKARVVPVIVRPVYWQVDGLSQLQALPKNALPLTEWKNQDSAWYSVTMGIRQVAKGLQEKPLQELEDPVPEQPEKQKFPHWRKVVLLLLVVAIVATSGALIYAWLIYRLPPPAGPVSHQSITLDDGEQITIGISDGNFSFTTQKGLDDNQLQKEANGEDCVYRNNRSITGQYVTVVALVTLSDTNKDKGASFESGNATLQGLCQKQSYYNGNRVVKVRLLVANIGTVDPPVLGQTMSIITQQLLKLSKEDKNFIGVIGASVSSSLDDSEHHINTMDQLKEAGIPVIATTASSSDSQFVSGWVGYFYRVTPGNDADAKIAANYAYNRQQKKTAFVFYDPNSSFSASLGIAFQRYFQGKSDVGIVSDAASSDFEKHLPALNANPPDMIFCACFASSTTPNFSVLYGALRDSQKYPKLKNVMLMGGSGLYNPKHTPYRDMTVTATTFPDTIDLLCKSSADQCSQEQKDFYPTYCRTFDLKTYNQNPADYRAHCRNYDTSRPSKNVALAYDALSTLLFAYDHLSSTSTSLLENVRSALPKVSFQGITGWIQLSDKSSNPVNKVILVLEVSNQGTAGIVTYCGKFTPAVHDYSLCSQQNG